MSAVPLQTACTALGIAYWMPLMAVRRRLLAAGPAPDYVITEAALQAWAARAKAPPAPASMSDPKVGVLETATAALSGRTAALEAKAATLSGTTSALQTTVASHEAMFTRMKAEPMLAAWLAPKDPPN